MIRIAGNDPVPVAVENHLRNVWSILQKFNRNVAIIDPEKTSHDALVFAVYQFSRMKMISQVKKYTPRVIKELDDLPSERRWEGFDKVLENLRFLKECGVYELEGKKEIAIISKIFAALYGDVTPILRQLDKPDTGASK